MDINYFEPIKKEKQKSNVLVAIIIGIILAAALAIALFSLMELMDQKTTQESLDAINSRFESESFAKLRDEVLQLESSIASLNETKSTIAEYEIYKNAMATGSIEMLSTIQSQITGGSLLTNLLISGHTISLNATSNTLTAMAQFSYNIANCGYFKNVLLDQVSVKKIEDEDGVSIAYLYTISADIVGADLKVAVEQMNKENEIEEETSSEEVAESEEN